MSLPPFSRRLPNRCRWRPWLGQGRKTWILVFYVTALVLGLVSGKWVIIFFLRHACGLAGCRRVNLQMRVELLHPVTSATICSDHLNLLGPPRTG
ncbi:hypothetical protein RRG08_005002 [Elysia crispata]|uniref:Uncharacterized protein n=1 Tax=Elysia crispata TaxID=231223 RepID=A0AAE0ZC87_9GAST|nr:hypothetical protein RRG08_005002 [Elysia crispata]